MRDTMAHRGPDGAGVWRGGGGGGRNVVLAHRRLAVVDLTEAAHQPMVTEDGRYAIVYNGELYNDAEVREELVALGVRFRSGSDTETVLRALTVWGEEGLGRLRGMYALGFVDTAAQTLLLARDPLGVKPLYWWHGGVQGGEELVFASEVRAVLAHPGVSARPDLVGISAYLTTIRTTLGERTLFEGVRTVRPGEVLNVRFGGEGVRVERVGDGVKLARAAGGRDVAGMVREVVSDSVRRHLRSDVPVCCLLSGGLDSSIVAGVAGAESRPTADSLRSLAVAPCANGLRTYCAGAEPGDEASDFAYARRVSAWLGTRHTEAPIGRAMFAERWREMVGAAGVPLSTPNEVAINEVARRLRVDGNVVALSGEGADELFAGYEGPMVEAARFIAGGAGCAGVDRGGPDHARFQLDSNAWVPVSAKGSVLSEGVWRALEGDAALVGAYRDEFARVVREGLDDDPLQAHLRFHRRVNLAGLLLRLDSATMLAGVEGRTPFADRVVAAVAEGLPMSEKFGEVVGADGERRFQTKRALRAAFADVLPADVVTRAKASFPLPFQEWVEDSAGVLRGSAFAREVFSAAAIQTVCAQPGRLWHLAWPMVNMAVWGEGWWG